MKNICLYFEVHIPYTLKRYRFFEIGNEYSEIPSLKFSPGLLLIIYIKSSVLPIISNKVFFLEIV